MEEVTMKTSPLESTWINYTYPDAPSMVYYLHFTEMHGKLVGKYSRPNEACGKKRMPNVPMWKLRIDSWASDHQVIIPKDRLIESTHVVTPNHKPTGSMYREYLPTFGWIFMVNPMGNGLSKTLKNPSVWVWAGCKKMVVELYKDRDFETQKHTL